MKSNVKRLFAGPYILWMIGFTIIPLLLIVYYGLTTKSGHLHWQMSVPSRHRSI